jgi:chromosome segregation ATPase
MIMKRLKTVLIVLVSLCLVGGFLFGKDLLSYVRSSAKTVQKVVKDSVPIEFELRRARDLLEEIIPEMHANIHMIAEEEVEIAALKTEITKSNKAIEDEQQRIKKLRQALEIQQDAYSFGDRQYTRDHVKKDLAERFDRFKESKLVQASMERVLSAREKSLQAAMQLLDRTRAQKRTLEAKIEGLASQYRLLKASAVGSHVEVDTSKLAQTQKLIDQIKKRLDVAERVLAHESRFVQSIPVDTITEKDLLSQVDDYFETGTDAESVD